MSRASIVLAGIALVSFGSVPTYAAPQQTAPDNTKSNQTSESDRTVTADSQKNDASDRDLVQRIRQAIIADKSLSTYAHNVKIIAIDGRVTLNGVVRSDDERSTVARLAEQAAGKHHVVNALKVAPPSS